MSLEYPKGLRTHGAESSSSMNSPPFKPLTSCENHLLCGYALQKPFWSTWNRARLGWKKARNRRSKHLSPRPYRFLLATHPRWCPFRDKWRARKMGNRNISKLWVFVGLYVGFPACAANLSTQIRRPENPGCLLASRNLGYITFVTKVSNFRSQKKNEKHPSINLKPIFW